MGAGRFMSAPFVRWFRSSFFPKPVGVNLPAIPDAYVRAMGGSPPHAIDFFSAGLQLDADWQRASVCLSSIEI